MSLRMSLAPDEELYVIRDLHDERCLLRHIGYKVVQLLKKKYIPLPQIKRYELHQGVFRAVLGQRCRLLKPPSILFFRIVAVMDVITQNIEADITMTLRDLYYLLKNIFPSEAACASCVNQLSMLLGVTRSNLRILGCSKGLVAGLMEYFNKDKWETMASSIPIPTACSMLNYRPISGSQAPQFIVVVEKHAVFHLLEEERIHEKYNCVLITGKGVPDLPTRAFVKLLYEKYRIPIYGICDFNPFGVKLMLNYTWGSQRTAEAYLYSVPIKVLGLSYRDTTELPIMDASWQDSTKHDLRECHRLANLLEPHIRSSDTLAESEEIFRLLEWMKTVRVKLELEALNRLSATPKPRWFQNSDMVLHKAGTLGRDTGSFLAKVWLPNILNGELE